MRIFDHFDLALRGVFASVFSLLSNTVSIFVGLLFFGLLMALSIGVGSFLEKYYSRTISLTTLLAFHSPGGQVFDPNYRKTVSAMNGVDGIFYHDTDFVDVSLSQDRSVTLALRSAVPDDPEIERLEMLAGTNLPQSADPLRPPIILPLLRAQQITDVAPEKLVGANLAITLLRTGETDEVFDSALIRGTIVGIANETPQHTAYVPYSVLAMANEWARLNEDVGDSGSTLDVNLELTSVAADRPAERAAGDKSDGTLADETGEHQEPLQFEPPIDSAHRPLHVHATLEDAWQGVRDRVGDDTIVYPHLRIHMKDVGSLVDMRDHFRRSGIPTTTSLDEIAAIRELRNYALVIGSAIGCITLVAAACSVFNTLIASVERRTREIGILRALGASHRNVLCIFLLEGAINALLGGALAAVFLIIGGAIANSWMIAKLSDNPEFAKVAELQPELFAVPAWLPPLLVLLGVCVSFVASLLPAVRACFIEPTSALRHE